MEKKKSEKKKSIAMYFLEMFLIFIAIDLVITILPGLLSTFAYSFKYGEELIVEIFYAIFALIVMLLFKNSYVFTTKQDKFKKAIMYAIPLLAFSVVVLFQSILSLDTLSIGNFVNVLIYCVFIGITEEFLCRGWLQNEFLERYGESKKNVITSIILSSLIFGLIHLVNVFTTTQGIFETLLQVVNACSLGFLLGSVYYKTKNIWSVIFLHAFYNFAIFLGEVNMVKDCTFGTPTASITLVNCASIALISVFWILSAVLVLKKCNFPDKKAARKNKSYSGLVTCIIVVGCLSFVPFENLVEGYDEYRICYTYTQTELEGNYIEHYPKFKEYEIDYTSEDATLLMDDKDSNSVQEVLMINNYHFKFSRNSFGKVVVENLNTGYAKVLDFSYVGEYGFEIIENEDAYSIVIETYDIDSTIYLSDFMTKTGMSNENEYLDNLAKSFKKYELPELGQLGYVTLEQSDYKYPFFYSSNFDEFIIKNGELFLLK